MPAWKQWRRELRGKKASGKLERALCSQLIRAADPMAFDFGSDILVDAMRAAKPTAADDVRVAGVSRAEAQTQSEAAHTPFRNALIGGGEGAKIAGREETVLRKFEATVLTTFIQHMLPKNADSVFGEGLSGDMWKSQMAEQIATQLAERGGIGIADRLLKERQKLGDESVPVSGLADPSSAIVANQSIDGATRYLQSVERDVLGLVGGDPKDDNRSGRAIISDAGPGR